MKTSDLLQQFEPLEDGTFEERFHITPDQPLSVCYLRNLYLVVENLLVMTDEELVEYRTNAPEQFRRMWSEVLRIRSENPQIQSRVTQAIKKLKPYEDYLGDMNFARLGGRYFSYHDYRTLYKRRIEQVDHRVHNLRSLAGNGTTELDFAQVCERTSDVARMFIGRMNREAITQLFKLDLCPKEWETR